MSAGENIPTTHREVVAFDRLNDCGPDTGTFREFGMRQRSGVPCTRNFRTDAHMSPVWLSLPRPHKGTPVTNGEQPRIRLLPV